MKSQLAKLPIGLKEPLGLYHSFINGRNYRPLLKKVYYNVARQFSHHLHRSRLFSFEEVSHHDLLRYMTYLTTSVSLRTGRQLGISAVQSKLFALRLYLDFIMKHYDFHHLSIPLPKFVFTQSIPKASPSIEEINLFIDAAVTPLERAIIALAYGCGMRRSEIINLKKEHCVLDANILIVYGSKFNKARCVPVSAFVKIILDEYALSTEYMENYSPFFLVDELGQNIGSNNLATRFNKIRQRIAPEELQNHYTLHSFRRALAAHLIDAGAQIEFVQKILGHTDVNTTNMYARNRRVRILKP